MLKRRYRALLVALTTTSLIGAPMAALADGHGPWWAGGNFGFFLGPAAQGELGQPPAPLGPPAPAAGEVETEGEGSVGAPLPFQDLGGVPWAQGAAALLFQQGIIQGTGNGYLDPNATLTRAQAVTMIGRFLGRTGWQPKPGERERERDREAYRHAPAWARPLIAGLLGDGLLFRGPHRHFHPNRPASRAWVTAQIVRALGLEGAAQGFTRSDLNFEDAAQIPDWAVGPVVLAVKEGIIQGEPAPDGGQVFDPFGTLTRAQMVVILARAEEIKAAGSDVVNGTVTAVSVAGQVYGSVYGSAYGSGNQGIGLDVSAANVSGSVYGSAYGSGGTITIASRDGVSRTYGVEPDARIYDHGPATLAQVGVGDSVTALLDQTGEIALLIDHAPRLAKLAGTVALANRVGRHRGWLEIQTADGAFVSVAVLRRTKIRDAAGDDLPFSAIQKGDQVTIDGRVVGQVFVAVRLVDETAQGQPTGDQGDQGDHGDQGDQGD